MDVEKTIEFLLEQQAAHQARFEAQSAEFWAQLKASQEKSDREDERLRRRLDRAVRLSALEHRRERARRKKLEAKTAADNARLKESQDALQRSITAFIESMKRGRNGDQR